MSKQEGKFEPRQLAEAHVDWFLKVARPLLIEEFVHGYKHGVEDAVHPRKDGE